MMNSVTNSTHGKKHKQFKKNQKDISKSLNNFILHKDVKQILIF
jgi:hypothetical protein